MKKTKLLKTIGCMALAATPIIAGPIILSTSCATNDPSDPVNPEINDPTPIELITLKKIGTWSNGEDASLLFDIYIDEKANENDPNVLRFAKPGCLNVPDIIPSSNWVCFGKNVEKSQADWQNVIKSDSIAIPNFAKTANLGDLEAPIDGIAYFEGSNDLKVVDIPINVMMINENCFKDCLNLQKIILTNGNLATYNAQLSINSYAFSGCKLLSDIKFNHQKHIILIGSFAFSDCINLSGELIIPPSRSGNSRIDEKAFANCVKLTGVTIPESVELIDASAFFGCKLTSLTFQSETAKDSISFHAFESLLDTIKVINVPKESSIQSYIDAFATDGVIVERSLFHPLS